MALNGSIKYTPANALIGITKYTLSWSRQDYSIEDNASNIEWKFIVTTNTADFSYKNYNYTIKINGNTYTGTLPINFNSGNNTVRTESLVIPHNADGTKSFSYEFSVTRLESSQGSASGSSIIDAIPRPATIASAADFNDEENPVITYNNISGELVTNLEACISFTGAEDDVPYREISKTESSYTFELTDAERKTLRKAIATGNSKTVRFYIKTTIDSYTSFSYLTKTFTLVNYTPVLTPTITEANAEVAKLTGDVNKLVRYYSNANVTFGAQARKEATLTKKAITNGSQAFTIEDVSQDSIVINNVDDNVFTLSATDSRGYTTTKQVHFKGDNFIPYFKVTCSQTVRLNLDGTAALTVKGKYYNGSFGAINNTLTIQTRQRRNNEEWSEWADITALISDISNNSYTLNSTISGYDPSGVYDFQCRAVDKLVTAESSVETITLKPIFDWGKYDFSFNVPVIFEGNPLADFVIEEGTEAMGTNGTWYWRKWKSGRAECYGCRNYGNMAVSTAWDGLYRSDTFTQAFPSGLFAQIPEVIDMSVRSTGRVGDGWIAQHDDSAPSASESGSFIVVRPAASTLLQVYISFNVIGRWK